MDPVFEKASLVVGIYQQRDGSWALRGSGVNFCDIRTIRQTKIVGAKPPLTPELVAKIIDAVAAALWSAGDALEGDSPLFELKPDLV